MAAVRAFMLSMLSVEFDSPGWEVIPVLWPEPPSMYASCADSVLLWAVMDMKGFEGVVRGGTGGGVFLYVVMHDDTAKRTQKKITRYKKTLVN